jgi:transcriptional regulator with XRE-family HTH domain
VNHETPEAESSHLDAPAAAALAGEVRRLRRQAGLSQGGLAARVGFSRQYVARVERPEKGMASANLVASIDAVLQADGALTQLHERARAEQLARRAAAARYLRPAVDAPAGESVSTGRSVDEQLGPPSTATVDATGSDVMAFNADVQRRAFLAGVVAASVGAATPEPLARLVEGLGADLPRHVGMSDVEAVEAAADAYMGFDLARSGDLAAAIARSSLGWSTKLLSRDMSEPTRERLSSAVALLADRLGWSIYDSGISDHAGRMLTFALNHAARGADRDLRAHVMLDLSTVVTDVGRPYDGVEILRAALGDERISAAERANLHAVCARHCASAGQQDSGVRHVKLAEEALAQHDTAMGPDWARQITFGPGHHDSALGLALFALGDADGARQRLAAALTALDSGRTRTGLRCRIRLAALHLREGEHDVGEAEAYRVIEDSAGVTSARVRKDLQMLRAHAARYDSPELVEDLSRLLAS